MCMFECNRARCALVLGRSYEIRRVSGDATSKSHSRILCFLWEVSDEMLGLLEERARPDAECVCSTRAKNL